MPTGIKTLQQQTIDAINKLITDNKTTQTQLDKLEIKLETKLDDLILESKINNKQQENITEENISKDDF